MIGIAEIARHRRHRASSAKQMIGTLSIIERTRINRIFPTETRRHGESGRSGDRICEIWYMGNLVIG